MSSRRKKTRIGVVGCGAIGSSICLYIDRHLERKAVVGCVSDKRVQAARDLKKRLRRPPEITNVTKLIERSDLVIETASKEAAGRILRKAIAGKKDVMVLSTGVFIKHPELLKAASDAGIKIYVPSGAICGVDGIAALSRGRIKSISLTTSKPPRGLIGAPYLKEKNIDLLKLKTERVIFRGGVRSAVKHFPKNINVAATLLLASSAEDIQVCIKADPKIKCNVHKVEVRSEEAKMTFSVENIPSKSNPKTSALTILSTQQLLEKIFSPVNIGS